MSAVRHRAIARLLPALAIAALVPVALSGCGVADVLHKQTSGTAATPRALEQAWRTPASEPDWVPADATDIRYIAATGGSADKAPASVRVTTGSALPTSCTTITRRSLDSFGESWAPKRFPDTVERCGNWAVMRVNGGWFGWTPLAPSEAEER
ncbi:hypothetical protein [Amnibacterium kyonggiense]|uniref:Lipoprotein n=1 Tax=Amnibacterium kyonggiense TaxID=595671 RepID=A0A4R7FRY7_9MICO|nr:hypothetical protein [Amnibacterium kyonggiense]TDS80583.1 hypothetical protein CLV52_1149 [Amnibacterium kyonggiense]